MSLDGRQRRMWRNVCCLCCIITATIIASIFLSDYAFASSNPGFSNSDTIAMGRIIHALALSGGALGLAWSGMEYALGNNQTSEKALRRMVMIAAATAAVYMLPAVIRAAKSLFESGAWSPKRLG